MNGNISDFFPILQERASGLFGVSVVIAMVMATGGLMAAIYRAKLNPGEYINAILGTGMVAIAISQFPDWSNLLQDIAQSILETLGADPSKSHSNFARLVTGVSDGEDAGFFDVLFSRDGGIGHAVLFAMIFLVSQIASGIMWLFFVCQQVLVQFQIGLSPIFLAMFLLSPLRGVAVKFVMSFIALLLWPVGWGIASLMTDTIIELAATNEIFKVLDDFYLGSPQTRFFTIVLSLWILLSTIAAPLIIHKVLTTGANAGAALLSRIGLGVTHGALFGTSAGVTAAINGASPAAVAGSAALGGSGGAIGGALGSNGVAISSAIGIGAAAAITSAGKAPADSTSKAHDLATQARASL